MTYRIVKNTRQNCLILATASNSAIVIAGNNSVSEIADSRITDNIVGCGIKQVWSSADSGAGANGWDIIRGANTVWQTDSTTWVDFAGNGCELDLDNTGTLTLTRTGSRGTILLELQKIYEDTGSETGTSEY